MKENMIPVLPARDAVHFPGLVNTLHVARDTSRRAAALAGSGDGRILVLSQRDMAEEEPSAANLHGVGTISEILQALPMPDSSLRLALKGLHRARVRRLVRRKGVFLAEVEGLPAAEASGVVVDALMRECLAAFSSMVELGKQIPAEALPSVLNLHQAGAVADTIAHHLPVRPGQKQLILEELDPARRLEQLLSLLRAELQLLELQKDISAKIDRELGTAQREYYLREQLRAIQNELQSEGAANEFEEYRRGIDGSGMGEAARAKALAELRRLERMPDHGPEAGVCRAYLECLISLPWNRTSEDRLDILRATELLDLGHHGLGAVKERILDFLAVRQLNPSLKGPILCFVGPPGVGKTSIGRSIAEALGRKFVRISLGGIRDEAEIRGHRRTYVGAMPGRLIQGLQQCGTRNPVFMLDEIDKIGTDYRGDATSALLEALDPEQNAQFSDHYVETPFDLSEVLFVTTANAIEAIPAPLRDRMEVITFSSYTDEERIGIARQFLLPKRARMNGLEESQIIVPDETLASLAARYTQEAGVRQLERMVDTLCRKAARRIAAGEAERVTVLPSDVDGLLGPARFQRDPAIDGDQVGAAIGLVVSEAGGGLITIEASLMEPSGADPALQLTGSLGDVMKESAQAALTFVRANASSLAPERRFRFDVHVHVPEGAMPKDGPSAGLTIAVALTSAYAEMPVRRDVAMTGEITLRGTVLPVGGIREKVLAARRAGIRHLVLPAQNVADLEEVPANVRELMVFHPVRSIREALPIALAPSAGLALVEVEPRNGVSMPS